MVKSKSADERLEAVDIDEVIHAENEVIIRLCKSRRTPSQLSPADSAPDAHLIGWVLHFPATAFGVRLSTSGLFALDDEKFLGILM
jgi:hypothetical protein